VQRADLGELSIARVRDRPAGRLDIKAELLEVREDRLVDVGAPQVRQVAELPPERVPPVTTTSRDAAASALSVNSPRLGGQSISTTS
jgi:hypothetical protein